MRLYKICRLVFALSLIPSQVLAEKSIQLDSETDKINYSVGYQIGGDFQKQGVGINSEAVVQGIRDALEQRSPLMPVEEMHSTLQNLKKRIVAEERTRQSRQTRKFLAENLKKEGVSALPNGVQYRIIRKGSGPKPTLLDSVKIHFLTKTTNGVEVSNTFKAKEPKVYRMEKILPGLQAVLPMMQEGSRWEVVIPTGHEGRRAKETLDKRGVLIYEIELLSVIPAKI